MVVWSGRRFISGIKGHRNAKVQTLNGIKKYPHTINANPFLFSLNRLCNATRRLIRANVPQFYFQPIYFLRQNWYKTPPSNIKNAGWWQERGTCPLSGIKRSPRNAKVQILIGIRKYPHTINANPFLFSLNRLCKATRRLIRTNVLPPLSQLHC